MATEPLDPTHATLPPPTEPARVQLVAIDAIRVPPHRLRGRREVDGLRESIAASGLLQPVLLDASMTLVCGLHRLEACRELGWRSVPAIVQEWSTVEARLAEVDENLCRRELGVLERAEHIALRRKLWDELRAARTPANDAAPAEGKGKRAKKPKAPSKRAELEALAVFVDDTARQTGRSASAVREEIRIGELPEEVRTLARETPVARNRRELLALTRMPEDAQREALERVRSGEAKTVRKRDKGAKGAAAGGEDTKGEGWNKLRAVLDAGGPAIVEQHEPTDEGAARALDDALEQARYALERALSLWPSDAFVASGDGGELPGEELLAQAVDAVKKLGEVARKRAAR